MIGRGCSRILTSTGKTDIPRTRFATRWQAASEFPSELAKLFATNDATAGAALLLAIPEHKVPLAGGARASQTDLWALARTPRGLLSVAVEGKVAESFEPTVGEWQSAATAGKRARWAALCKLLEIDHACDLAIQYQLFHRTASALIEAKRFFATGAAVVVHSFSATQDSFADFQRFVSLMGGHVDRPGELVAVAPRERIDLFFGWAQGPPVYRQETPMVEIVRTTTADSDKPKFGTLKARVTALDPHWWKPMTNDEVEAFLDGR